MAEFDGIPLPEPAELRGAIDLIEESCVQPLAVAQLRAMVEFVFARRVGEHVLVFARDYDAYQAWRARTLTLSVRGTFRYVGRPELLIGFNRPEVILIEGCQHHPDWPRFREMILCSRAWITYEPERPREPRNSDPLVLFDELVSVDWLRMRRDVGMDSVNDTRRVVGLPPITEAEQAPEATLPTRSLCLNCGWYQTYVREDQPEHCEQCGMPMIR